MDITLMAACLQWKVSGRRLERYAEQWLRCDLHLLRLQEYKTRQFITNQRISIVEAALSA
jgi:hypothetical protein